MILLSLLLSLLAQQPSLYTLRQMYVQQQQVDALQARLDAGSAHAIVSLDTPVVNSSGVLEVGGWSFTCGEESGTRLVVMVDGVTTTQVEGPDVHFTHYSRPDVANVGNVAYCASVGSYVPTANAGFFTLVYVDPFGAGWNSNGQHTVQVRLFTTAGKMASSEIKTFVKY